MSFDLNGKSRVPVRVANPMLAEDLVSGSGSEVGRESKKSTKFLLAMAAVATVAAFVGGLQLGSFLMSFSQESSKSVEDPVPDQQRTVFVHLFEWTWKDIEKECLEYLGPNGFAAVQVSPVMEHVDHRKLQDYSPVNFPWWARYQPVSYKLDSRSGTREELISMVRTCKSVGVDIYADVLLNHMGRDNTGTGIAGTPFNKDTLEYSVYSSADFNYCEPSDIQGSDYGNNAERVRRCRLVDLPDLNHDSAYVRGKLIEHMQDLVNIGIAGFRLDAAKHMYPHHMQMMLGGVQGDFYSFAEVIDRGNEAISSFEYAHFTDVTEFKYQGDISHAFSHGRVSSLVNLGQSGGYLGTLNAVVFTDNHDTQRYEPELTYKDGKAYELANVFMLTWPYGYPKIMSSYKFSDQHAGPPADSAGNTKRVWNDNGTDNCGQEWLCDHRNKGNLVKFRNYVNSVKAYHMAHWWSNGFQAVGFARTDDQGKTAGFVIINKEGFELQWARYFAGLPDGTYCDLGSGAKFVNGSCSGGAAISVKGGFVETSVPAMSAILLQLNAKIN